MTLRGVNVPGASLSTSQLIGVVRDDPRTREEFLRLVRA
jgi:GTP cyclohydrolase I